MDEHGTHGGGGPDGAADHEGPAVLTLDGHGDVAGWSDAAQRLLGYPASEAVGMPVGRLLPHDAPARLAAPGSWNGPVTLRHQDGRAVPAEALSCPWQDRIGRPRHVVLLRSRPGTAPAGPAATGGPDVEQAFVQAPLPMALLDTRLRIVRASRGMADECGLAEADLQGRRLADVLPTSPVEDLEEHMRRALADGEPQRLRIRLHGSEHPRDRVWAVLLSPLTSPAGKVHGLQLTAVDATEQHWSRERLALLDDVSTRVGSTLEVSRTAQEMADLAVERFADFVTVDLLDAVFRGTEPATSARVAMRRAAHQSVLPGVPEALTRLGQVDEYPHDSPPALCIASGEAALLSAQDKSLDRWRAGDPGRAAVVEAFGIHSVMVVPLRARGVSLGVAVLCRHRRPEPFDRDDLLLAKDIAARAALSIDNARRYTRERTVALALQRSLLPHRFADQQAVQVACRYFPAGTRAGVGGDWFDVIPLPGARVALVVGDVVGHGLRASATMGRLRTAVRTLADVDLAPDELLVQLDDLVTHLTAEEAAPTTGNEPELQVPTDLVATCLYLVYDPIVRRCCFASAGHLPPLVVSPDGTAEQVELAPGPPLGMGGLPFEPAEREIPAGSLIALYTDGLIEAGKRDVDTGLTLLREALARPAATLEAACDTVTDLLRPERRTDDAALLLARTRALAGDRVAAREIPEDPAGVAEARAWASRRLQEWDLTEAAFVVELVVSELVTNAIRYGRPPLRLRMIRTDSVVICEVSDASGAAPHLRRARVFDEGGRGLLLVAQLSRRWGSRHIPSGKIIWSEVAAGGEPDVP